ncbi:hypothetical protein QUF88_18325 [Bacillus sp. DX1.1]|uniref:hypothetical protein n=1 Tax=unclassified Bacillus (in: firmicutes) TaxID=185979 RepID=UPI00256FC80A|nr:MULTISPECIES: hypothetical protein [unclassified Bacillus (in: firmicutes)]MDM5155673.1 hypothetical protein [Bacillus sp. DX1.1]WJE79977.1 hypothetical protein QRE67_15855 [Bacillus sp. DX3.1]
MKKLLAGFVSFAAVLTIGSFTASYSPQADHGRPPAPQRPDLTYNIGDTPAPAENRGDTWSADGDTGSSAYNKGDTPAPQA